MYTRETEAEKTTTYFSSFVMALIWNTRVWGSCWSEKIFWVKKNSLDLGFQKFTLALAFLQLQTVSDMLANSHASKHLTSVLILALSLKPKTGPTDNHGRDRLHKAVLVFNSAESDKDKLRFSRETLRVRIIRSILPFKDKSLIPRSTWTDWLFGGTSLERLRLLRVRLLWVREWWPSHGSGEGRYSTHIIRLRVTCNVSLVQQSAYLCRVVRQEGL